MSGENLTRDAPPTTLQQYEIRDSVDRAIDESDILTIQALSIMVNKMRETDTWQSNNAH